MAVGDYPVRLLYYEGGGGAGCELFASAGSVAKTAYDTTFHLVGDLAHEGIPLMPSATVATTVYKAAAGFNLDRATAQNIVNTPSLQSWAVAGWAPFVNYMNTDTGAGNFRSGLSGNQNVADWTFPNMTIGTDIDNYVDVTTGIMHIATSGPYTFDVSSDDGFQLQIFGATFDSAAGQGGTTVSGNTLYWDGGRGGYEPSSYGIINNLAAGDYSFRLMHYEGGGGSSVELSASPNVKTAFDSTFALVGDTAHGGIPLMPLSISNLPDDVYTVTLDGSSGTPITDLAGNRLNGNQPSGNHQVTFKIDTTAPTVGSVTPNLTLLTDANVGTSTFTVTVVYNEQMNQLVAPTLTFSPAVASTLTLNAGASSWLNNTTYVARYNVADANVIVSNIGIGVTLGTDVAGNVQTAYSGTNNFNIDTHNPTVTSVTPNLTLLSDATAALAQPAFSVTVVYSEAMNPAFNPTITFTPALAGTLTFVNAPPSGWNPGNTTYVAWYTVTDANVTAANVGIGVTAARIANGNLQVPYSGTNNFNVDTQNPTITSVTPNLTTVGDPNGGTATFWLTVLYSEPMNTSVKPTVTFPVEDPERHADL